MFKIVYAENQKETNTLRQTAKEDKMYIIRDHCINCKSTMWLVIPFGTPKDKAISDPKVDISPIKCPYCGCNPIVPVRFGLD